jgi:hypothetical protein
MPTPEAAADMVAAWPGDEEEVDGAIEVAV